MCIMFMSAKRRHATYTRRSTTKNKVNQKTKLLLQTLITRNLSIHLINIRHMFIRYLQQVRWQ